MVVFDLLGHCWHRDRVQPAQYAQLAVRGAKSVKNHGPHEGFDIDLPLARAPKFDRKSSK
jgi:hypothetical protein